MAEEPGPRKLPGLGLPGTESIGAAIAKVPGSVGGPGAACEDPSVRTCSSAGPACVGIAAAIVECVREEPDIKRTAPAVGMPVGDAIMILPLLIALSLSTMEGCCAGAGAVPRTPPALPLLRGVGIDAAAAGARTAAGCVNPCETTPAAGTPGLAPEDIAGAVAAPLVRAAMPVPPQLLAISSKAAHPPRPISPHDVGTRLTPDALALIVIHGCLPLFTHSIALLIASL